MSAAVEMDDVDLGLQPEPEPEPASKSADEEDEQYDVGPSVSFVREGKAELEGLRLGGDGISVASFERAALGHQLSPNGSDNVDAAGLAVGSEIVSVDGWRVKNARHLRRKLKKVPEGNTVSLRFAVPGGRHSRQPSYDKQQHSSKELRVRLDLTRETTVTVQMKDSVSDLKGRIAKAAVKQGVKGSSAEGYADGAFLVIAVVGERGVRLSGGQKQRIGIARALYKSAQILILDEATSALDSVTETLVMESIKSIANELTIIIIAHRVSTLSNCDRVVEFCNGTVKRIVPPTALIQL